MRRLSTIILVTITSFFILGCEVEESASPDIIAMQELISSQQALLNQYMDLLAEFQEQESSLDDMEPELLRETLRAQQNLLDIYQEQIKNLQERLEASNINIEQGDYTPGVYFGYTSGHESTFAVVTVNENGVIESILVDSVYLQTQANGPLSWVSRGNDVSGIAVTKRTLDGGCGYDMHRAAVNCEVEDKLMWHQQVDAIAAAVIENQGLPSWNINNDGYMDDLAGVSITVDGYISAIQNALNKAKP